MIPSSFIYFLFQMKILQFEPSSLNRIEGLSMHGSSIKSSDTYFKKDYLTLSKIWKFYGGSPLRWAVGRKDRHRGVKIGIGTGIGRKL